jgi:hypothetical protein
MVKPPVRKRGNSCKQADEGIQMGLLEKGLIGAITLMFVGCALLLYRELRQQRHSEQEYELESERQRERDAE